MWTSPCRRHLLLGALLMISACSSLQAAEYFLSTQGDDGHDGLSPQRAFATLQKGVDALQPGDTLTIAPGEYGQGAARTGLGSDQAQTTIRAQIPGTVVLRGDVPAPAFAPVPGKRFVYAAPFQSPDGPPQAVIEHDSRKLLTPTADPAELEFVPGLFHYDPQRQVLSIATSDMSPPTGRLFSVSVRDGSGLYLGKPRRVVIEGLAVTGFFRVGAHREPPCLWGVPWGIALSYPVDCVVRHCRTYLNAGGIAMDGAFGTVIEDCVAFANQSRYDAVAGNIMSLGGLNKEGSSGNLIRRCIAFGGAMGIHQYGWMTGHVVIRDCITWNNLGSNLHVKTGRSEDNQKFGLIDHSVALGGTAGGLSTRHNLIVGHAQYEDRSDTDIRSEAHPDLDLSREMADPDNLDFRLQSDSRFRGAGQNKVDRGPQPYTANVFYVKPDGDDAGDGLSMRTAWRTLARATQDLRPGHTLYLEPGRYDSTLTLGPSGTPSEPVVIRGRGRAPVIIEGGLKLTDAAAAQLERLTFTAAAELGNSANLSLINCTFAGGLKASSVRGLRVSHSVLSAGLTLSGCTDVHLSGNHYKHAESDAVVVDDPTAIAYSDYNGYQDQKRAWRVKGASKTLADLRPSHDRYSIVLPPQAGHELLVGRGPAGTNLGIHHERQLEAPSLRVIGPFVHSVTDTTVNLEWWTTAPTGLTVTWGDTPQTMQSQMVEAHRFGTFSLTGLKPGTTYSFTLKAEALPNHAATIQFTTAKSASAARVYHVAPDGDDSRDGLSRLTAWRTVQHAADRVGPGDTVLIAEGRYAESVRVRRTGERERPVTFKAAPGQKVTLHGQKRSINGAFYAAYKHHVHVDGLYFSDFSYTEAYHLPWSDREPGNGTSGVFNLYQADDAVITRCFNDGRGGGYAPGLVQAVHSRNLRIHNCVNVGTMGPLVTFYGCPELQVQNNVCIGNFIYAVVGVNEPSQMVHLNRNIMTDSSLTTKAAQPLIEVGNVESLAEGDNCYLLRTPDEVKKLFFFYDANAYGRAASMFQMRTSFEQPMRIGELTRLSLAEYQAQFNPRSGSWVGDPGFVAAKGLTAVAREGLPPLISDHVISRDDLDFPGLFATDTQVTSRDVGLQATAFADFHFNRAAAGN